MGEQLVDLPAMGAALRRHRGAIAFVGLLGALMGAGMPLLHPPMYTSTSEVLLPTPITASTQNSADPQTQVEIASSAAVLGSLGGSVQPALSFRQLGQRIKVTAPSDQTVEFSASAPRAADAEKLASMAAASEVTYVADAAENSKDQGLVTALHKLTTTVDQLHQTIKSQGADSPPAAVLSAQLATLTGELETLSTSAAPTPGTATILQPASPAARPGFVSGYVVPTLVGLLAGLLLGALVVVLAARLDRRLRTRDRLAHTVGTPVIASFGGRFARGIGGWHHLVAEYDPAPVDAWALRQILRQIPSGPEETRAVTVVCLDTDLKGMALGPLLASYAAFEGIRTELVVGEAPRSSALAMALRRAAGTELRPGLHVSDGAPSTTSDLTVTIEMVPARTAPGMLAPPQGEGPVLLSIAAGAATAKQAAHAAMAADTAGRVVGLVVVDPDATDRTPGRLTGTGPVPVVPTRLPGIATKGARR